MGTYTDIDTTGLNTNGWVPTFFDGFDGAYLDRAAWPIVQYGTGANGAFTYSPNNIFGYDGEMDVANIATPGGWTSGAFQQGWNGQMYGNWSINARFDAGQGTTAAILLWPEGGVGTNPYEIDLVEPRSADKTTLNNVTVHGPGGQAITVPFNFDATQWHTYSVQWTPGLIDIYLDGTKIFETNQDVPNVPMSLGFLGYVTNGGDTWFGGAPNAQTPSTTALHIDWVREWTMASQYPGDLPAALYGTSTADLHPTSNTYTGQWTAGQVLDANGNREYAITGQRTLDGTTSYAATWNSAAWNSELTLVTDAPTTWSPTNASHLLFANFVDAELDFRAAGTTALALVVDGAQHGNVALGDGNNSMTWVEADDTVTGHAGPNTVMTIVAGNGNNSIELTAPAFTDWMQPFGWGNDWQGGYDGHASVALVRTGNGNDTITIDAGQAIIDAGAGDNTVAWHAPEGRFAVSVAADGATVVADSLGILGTTLLYNVQHLRFSDASIGAPSVVPDPTLITTSPIGSTPSPGLPPTSAGTGTVTPASSAGATDWNAIGAAMTDYHTATGQWWGADYANLLSWDATHNAQMAAGTAPAPAPAAAAIDWNALAAQAEANFAATGHWYL